MWRTVIRFAAPSLLVLISAILTNFALAAHREYGRLHRLPRMAAAAGSQPASPETYFQRAQYMSMATVIVLLLAVLIFLKTRRIPWLLAVLACVFVTGYALVHAGIRY